MRKYYRVCNSDGWNKPTSFSQKHSGCVSHPPIGEWLGPPKPGYGPYAVFGTLEDAVAFRNRYGYPTHNIFECEVVLSDETCQWTQPGPIESRYMFAIKENPDLYDMGWHRGWFVKLLKPEKMPAGKVLVSAIKLTRRVEVEFEVAFSGLVT